MIVVDVGFEDYPAIAIMLLAKPALIAVEGLVKTRGGVEAVPPRRGSTPAPRPN
jgi:hypothetical protein